MTDLEIKKTPNKHKIVISYLPKSSEWATLCREDLNKLNFRIWVIDEKGNREELMNRNIEEITINAK